MIRNLVVNWVTSLKWKRVDNFQLLTLFKEWSSQEIQVSIPDNFQVSRNASDGLCSPSFMLSFFLLVKSLDQPSPVCIVGSFPILCFPVFYWWTAWINPCQLAVCTTFLFVFTFFMFLVASEGWEEKWILVADTQLFAMLSRENWVTPVVFVWRF